MSYERVLWLPGVLRAVGLQVVEHPGWTTRGLSTARPFTPRAVVWHHDASAPGDSPGVPDYMIHNFSSAAAQCWVDRAGRWHLIASGRAPHTGAVLPGMPTNETSIGVETDHTTGEDWPPALLASLRRGTAAILRHLGVLPGVGLHFHRTICSPPGRKTDPDRLNLAAEREQVALAMTSATGGPSRGAGAPLPLPSTPPRPVPEEDDLMLIPAGTPVTLPVPEAAPGTIRRLYVAAADAADVSVIFRQGAKVTRAITWHVGDGQSAMASLTAANTAIGGLPTSVSISARTPVVAVIAAVPA